MHRSITSVACVVLACLALTGASRAATLAGRVVERATGRPVVGVLVTLSELGRATPTDADGRFAFAGVAPGLHALAVRNVAWAAIERVVRVGTSDDDIVLALTPAVHRMDDVIVRSARSSETLLGSSLAALVVGGDALRSRGSVTTADALADAPGVALVRDGSWPTAVSIRGQSRANVVTLVDDTRLETAQDLAGALSLVDDAELERVEVITSPGSVLFGTGALGGAIHLVSRRPRLADDAAWSGEWNTSARVGTSSLAHHAAVERSGPGWAARVSAGRRRAGDTHTPAGPIANSSFGEWSTSAAVAARGPGDLQVLASYQRAQAEDAGIPGGAAIAASATATYRVARRERVALELTRPLATARLVARLAHQRIAREVEIVQSPTVLVTPHATHDATSAQVEARLLPGARHVTTVGAEGWRRDLDSRRERLLRASGRWIGERPVPRASHTSGGAYVQHEWAIEPERTHVVLGARADANRMRNDRALQPEWAVVNGVPQTPPVGQFELWPAGRTLDASWDASVGVHRRWTRALSGRARAATAYRSPSLEERFQYLDLGSTLRVGQPHLRPERSRSLEGGVRFEGRVVSLQVDGFVNAMTDRVSEEPGTFQGRAAFVKTNVGRAQLHGFEATADARPGGALACRGTLAFVRGLDFTRGADLAQVAPLAGAVELRAAFGRHGRGWLACTAAATQRHPGPGESVTPGWTRWSAGFASAPFGWSGVRFTASAGVDNVFDRAYRQHLSTLRGAVPLEPGRTAWIAVGTAAGSGAP